MLVSAYKPFVIAHPCFKVPADKHLYCIHGFTLSVIFSVDCHFRHGSVELTADEKASVLQQLPTGVSHTEVDSVLAVLSQILTGSTAANEEDIGEQDQVLHCFFMQYIVCFTHGNLSVRPSVRL